MLNGKGNRRVTLTTQYNITESKLFWQTCITHIQIHVHADTLVSPTDTSIVKWDKNLQRNGHFHSSMLLKPLFLPVPPLLHLLSASWENKNCIYLSVCARKFALGGSLYQERKRGKTQNHSYHHSPLSPTLSACLASPPLLCFAIVCVLLSVCVFVVVWPEGRTLQKAEKRPKSWRRRSMKKHPKKKKRKCHLLYSSGNQSWKLD